jgi:putative nucleotidyltransferase with HDIG domain
MIHREKVLVIDDEHAPRESLRMVLKGRFDVTTASGGLEGLKRLDEDPADIVVLDIRMPVMDGMTALKEIKERYPGTEVVLLTAYASLDSARDALRLGAFDYLMKPFDKDDLIQVVDRGLQKKRDSERVQAELDLLKSRNNALEEQISVAQKNIVNYYDGTVRALNLTIDAKDHYTYNHSGRVVRLASALADGLGLPENEKEQLELAAAIHDIGKIGVDEKILNKAGSLTKEEYDDMKRHPEIGARIIESVPFLKDAVPVIYSHHEKYDGTGYPSGLRADTIPLKARIVMVADAVDSMMHNRPYRKSLPMEKVMSELRDNSGIQFDPMVAELILKRKTLLH